jgi:hypothetical protein
VIATNVLKLAKRCDGLFYLPQRLATRVVYISSGLQYAPLHGAELILRLVVHAACKVLRHIHRSLHSYRSPLNDEVEASNRAVINVRYRSSIVKHTSLSVDHNTQCKESDDTHRSGGGS